jgi:quercetin dioxygenase-like cupin family protein
MNQIDVAVKRWPKDKTPDESEIRKILADEGLHFYQWSNRPCDIYSAHNHPYHKVIYVLQGSITFGLPDKDDRVTLNTGDRLELPAGTNHDAVVGDQGVICLEAHR